MREYALPEVHSFLAVMERTVQLVGDNVPLGTLQKVAEVLGALRWDFRDYDVRVYFLVNPAGVVNYAREWPGTVDAVVSMDALTFHKTAYGSASFGTALLMGKLSITGLSALNLIKFTPLLKPFLDSYRQACAEFHGSTV